MAGIRKFIAAILIIAFIILVIIAWNFIDFPDSFTGKSEGFVNKKGGGPTRAADCKCLPGYIPSKHIVKNKYGGTFKTGAGVGLGDGNIYFYPDGSKTAYWIDNCTVCNDIIPNVCDIHTRISKEEFTAGGYTTAGEGKPFDCNILKKAMEKEISPYYFCQNFTDPKIQRKCY